MSPADPKTRVQQFLAEGDPAREIIQFARESRCDLIVMGTHGRTGFERVLWGSVAEEVVRKAPCPVMTVKAEAAGDPIGQTSGHGGTKGPADISRPE